MTKKKIDLEENAEEIDVNEPSPAPKEDMVTMIVDREMTDGGIRINGKRYIGEVTVPREIANSLKTIQEEYFETKKKLTNKNTFVRTKNDAVKFKRFCVDPEEFPHLVNNPNFQKYGLLDARDWEYLTEPAKELFKRERMAMYNY